MNAIIIGGTGFIGYHTAQRLLSEGYNVTITSRNAPPEGVFAAAIRWQKLDITACSDAELCALLRDNPYIVFAASADDRTLATAPAADFFARRNVQTVAQIVRCAEQTKAQQTTQQHLIIWGSYFTYFEREWARMQLAAHHPYINSRKAQAAAAFASNTLIVSVLEIPYVIGHAPHLVPLWQPLVRYVNLPLPFVLFMRGGTAVVTVQQVAAATAYLFAQTLSGSFAVVSRNMTWHEWLTALQRNPNKPLRVVQLPKILLKMCMFGAQLALRASGKAAGLNPVALMDLQTSDTFLPTDFSETVAAANPNLPDFEAVMREMVAVCV